VTASDWLALAAFVLALAAFITNSTLSWLRWPRVVVDISSRANVYIPPLTPLTPEEAAKQEAGELEPVYCDTYDTFTVAVINTGAEAFTIRTIGLLTANEADRWTPDTGPAGVVLVYEAPLSRTQKLRRLLRRLAWPDKPKMIRTLGNPYTDYEKERDANQHVPVGPELPARIEPNDVKLWTYHNHLLRTIPRNTKVVAYADRYKTFRWWPHRHRSIVGRTVSERTVTRNGTTVKQPPQGNIPPSQRVQPRA
jgi:hypothetical protein